LDGAKLGQTVFGDTNLTNVQGLDEATYSRAEGRVGRQRKTTPLLNRRFQRQP
jgi:hypothetical protein